LLRRAWGWRSLGSAPEPMTADTVFDLASLTKVVCTTTAVLQLAERDQLQLDAPAARYWPAFAANGKAEITVRQLLSHSSGLRPGLSLQAGDDAKATWARLLAERPTAPPGSRLVYSDLNFLALGMLIQRVAGRSLDQQCHRRIFEPLRMHDTGFRPPAALRPRIAPTEPSGAGWLRGTVQDPTARRLGGVAGNAGLFGSADDLARFAQALLRHGADAPLYRATIAELQQPQGAASATSWHGLGWQLIAPLEAEREGLPPIGAIGHTGYTGTGLWIDFTHRRFVVLLTSRLHPDGRGDARPLRRQVLALMASLQPGAGPRLSPPAGPRTPGPDDGAAAVWSGIDMLRQQGYAALQGRRIGLVTHAAAIDRHGWRTLDRLRLAPGVRLVRVFTPEHGLNADAEGRIDSGTEAFSGLPLVSLYGGSPRPPPDSLQDIDTLVIDLQDAGARFYTYLATLGECLRAAAKAGVKVVVLDRPNPAGADRVSGPMLDPALRSFTAWTTLPVQHGMTIGELARYLADELRRDEGLAPDLQVITMSGYRRTMSFEQTGLDWVPPSPNLKRPSSARLYPGVAWVEGAPVSVGRGTEHPFEWVGAPWIDGPRLAQALAALGLPGVAVQPVEFVPQGAAALVPYAGQRCQGVALRVVDRERFDASLLGAALVQALHRLWPERFHAERTLGMVGSAQALQQLRDGVPPGDARQRWEAGWGGFMRRRAAALLYETDGEGSAALPEAAASAPRP
jgi:uncharacterized protein YbbC (DUF1343 family)/CubicO group peptidase (beta-lactamase class C family)